MHVHSPIEALHAVGKTSVHAYTPIEALHAVGKTSGQRISITTYLLFQFAALLIQRIGGFLEGERVL